MPRRNIANRVNEEEEFIYTNISHTQIMVSAKPYHNCPYKNKMNEKYLYKVIYIFFFFQIYKLSILITFPLEYHNLGMNVEKYREKKIFKIKLRFNRL